MRTLSKPDEPSAPQTDVGEAADPPYSRFYADGPLGRMRKRWSAREKWTIVQESYDPQSTVTAVARKNKVSSVSIYHWRKKFGLNALRVLDGARASVSPEAGEPWRPTVAALSGHDAGSGDDEGNEGLSRRPATGSAAGLDDRVLELTAEVARLTAELHACKSQQRLLIGVARSISNQLSLITVAQETTAFRRTESYCRSGFPGFPSDG